MGGLTLKGTFLFLKVGGDAAVGCDQENRGMDGRNYFHACAFSARMRQCSQC